MFYEKYITLHHMLANVMVSAVYSSHCLLNISHLYTGTFIMIESPYIFNKMYKLLSPYIDPNTAKKLVFAQGPTGKGGGADLRETLSAHMDEELVEWMITEMTENR